MNPSILLEKLLKRFTPTWSPTMFKATILAAFAAAFVIPTVLVALPFIEFLNGMAAQWKGKTQGTYGRIHGQELLVERAAPEGTMPRGVVPYPFDHLGDSITDAITVGESLANPVPPTMENLRRGQDLYNIYCIACHGPKGHGDGPVTGANRFPTPPSLHTEQARAYRDGTVFHIITRGVGKMPNYRDKLDAEERWKVVHYLHALQRAESPSPEDLAEAAR